MKTKHLINLLLVVLVTTFSSCGSSSSDSEGGGGTPITSIAITANNYGISFGSDFVFIVRANDGSDVTSSAVIYIDEVAITGDTFTPESSGSYTVKASYNELTSPSVPLTVDPSVQSITVIPNVETTVVGSTITYTIEGIDSDGNEASMSSAVLFVNGTKNLVDYNYIPSETGQTEAYAKIGDVTSEVVYVNVEALTVEGSFTKKVLIEDYTDTYCQYCPRIAKAIELAVDASPDVVPLAIHLQYVGPDPFKTTFGAQLWNKFRSDFGFIGLPAAALDRKVEWNYDETQNVPQATNMAGMPTDAGLSISSIYKHRNLSVTVSAGFLQNYPGSKLVVYLVENKLKANQINATPYYGGTNPIVNMQHDHVLRHSFTNVLGDAIPADLTVANNVYTKKIDFQVPYGVVSFVENTEIVAMIVGPDNKVINVGTAPIGTQVNFN